jgi:hypothetical protein
MHIQIVCIYDDDKESYIRTAGTISYAIVGMENHMALNQII